MELLLVVSVDPLRNVLRGLQSIATSRSIRSSSPTVFAADEPTAVIESLLADIDQSTRATTPLASQPTAAKGSDPSKLMVLSAIIEVV
jgi:sugar-specific transcriptional regulator TrmB